ncbi:MAG: phosphoribosylamine--glycine ligase [Candidatus Eisenbacteria bacterium]
MKTLIVGSGGREHALGWALRQADPKAELLFAPGNAGTTTLGRNVAVGVTDLDALVSLAESERPDFTLVGPEGPLVAGLVDRFRARGLAVFGPSQRAAEIEGSKVFAKDLLRASGVATAAYEIFHDGAEARRYLSRSLFPQVIKVDGLAAGKGVYIARNLSEGEAALDEIVTERRHGTAGARIVIESFLEGEEVSAFALCRGEEFRLLPFSRDYKRAFDNDEGPNTGGMGAIAPHPLAMLNDEDRAGFAARVESEVFAPVLHAMTAHHRAFHGLLYAGLMVVDGRPHVLEFNCRFGDPETEAVVTLLGDGFLPALHAIATGEGELPSIAPWRGGGFAATVILASANYPGDSPVGLPMRGLDKAAGLPDTFVFHAGTRAEGSHVVTAGGRVLAVTGRGEDPRIALSRAYDGASVIEFDGKRHRTDIGRTSTR